jgi:serine/threonine protein kinase
MDAITAAVVDALPALASDLIKSSVKDAYAGLKAIIRRQWGDASPVAKSLDALEVNPKSGSQAEVLAYQVAAVNATADPEVKLALAKLVEQLKKEGMAVNIGGGVAQGVVGAENVSIGSLTFKTKTIYVNASSKQKTLVPGSTQASLPHSREFPIATGECDRESGTSLEDISNFLERKSKINVKNLIKMGQLSDVYCGEHGRRKLAIKAFPNCLFPSRVKEALLEEVAITSRLNHASFLRIADLLFATHICFIVSDYVEAPQTIAREVKLKGAAAFSINEVFDVLNQLCEAMVEAEAVGLAYLSIIPSQIFVKDVGTAHYVNGGQNVERRLIVRLSPINLMLFKSQVGEFGPRWDIETGPFMAPEFWHGANWFKERMTQILDRGLNSDELRRARVHKSNQFALGMLAWTMLEGRIPITTNVSDDPEDMKEQFLQDSECFSTRVAEAPWRTKARALSRIVQRMVEYDPAKRWASTNHVHLLIKALVADYTANEVDNLVKEAYKIAGRGSDSFYQSFYIRFFAKATPGLREKFSDMSRQYRMLNDAIGQLLNFRQQQCEPTTLTQFVSQHKNRGFSKHDFEEFGNALIESFDIGLAKAEGRQRMMAALEIVIWPGIYYMIEQCTS